MQTMCPTRILEKFARNEKHTVIGHRIKVDIFDDLMLRWKKEHFERFENSPFGHFLKIQRLKVQPQLLRNLLQAETENNRDDLFIFRLNDNLLHFGKRKFCVVTGLRFDKKNNFYSDFKAPNKLMSKYYSGIEKMKRSDFYTDFAVTENFLKKMICMKLSQFKDIVFTDEEMVKYNLLAIHQDSFVHQEQDNFVHTDVDDKKNSSSNVKDEQIFDMKNELANVRAEMLKFQKKLLASPVSAPAFVPFIFVPKSLTLAMYCRIIDPDPD
ncbi:hypothetical protein FXO37_06050 [Capsicum annuum]|nr:hypothetical protein FXO37_06050 [Capsicum annuum]